MCCAGGGSSPPPGPAVVAALPLRWGWGRAGGSAARGALGAPGGACPALPCPHRWMCSACASVRVICPSAAAAKRGTSGSSGARAGVGIAQIIRKRVAEPLIYLSARFPFPCVSICGARRCVAGVGKGRGAAVSLGGVGAAPAGPGRGLRRARRLCPRPALLSPCFGKSHLTAAGSALALI